MSANKETLTKTVGVVLAVCLVCSIIVSGAAVGLRSQQQANAALDKQFNILTAANLIEQADGDIPGTYAAHVTERFVDLDSGEYVDVAAGYDMYKAAKNKDQSIALTDTSVGFLRRANVVNVYEIRDAAGQITSIVLPVYGSGLWDLMYGFLAVSADGETVQELIYYQQKETPGLGGEVQNPAWQAKWNGKKLYKNGEVAVSVTKNAGESNPYAVDALSGATLTSNGVDNTLKFWAGELGFAKFLRNKAWAKEA